MSETVNDYAPGRSFMAEMVELKEQMTALRAAMLEMVDLQRDIHTKLDAALNIRHTGDGVSQCHDSSVNN